MLIFSNSFVSAYTETVKGYFVNKCLRPIWDRMKPSLF